MHVGKQCGPPAANLFSVRACFLHHRLSDLDLGHFEIKKENVTIALAPPSERAGALEGLKDAFVIDVQNVSARIPNLKWSFELQTFPYLNSEGLASAVMEGGCAFTARALFPRQSAYFCAIIYRFFSCVFRPGAVGRLEYWARISRQSQWRHNQGG